MIQNMIKQELPQLVDDRRLRRRDQEQPVERDEFGRVYLLNNENARAEFADM